MDEGKQQEQNQSTHSTLSERETFQTGAQRSQRLPRYDLIYKRALDRLAARCTGAPEIGGAHKYGEGNWQKGLPTSDTINHIIDHITKWQDTFRSALTGAINKGVDPSILMGHVQHVMEISSSNDDDLAGAMWGIMVLMYQEEHGMFHDDSFKIPHVVVDYVAEPGDDAVDRMYGNIMNLSLSDFEKIAHYVATLQDIRKRQTVGILKEEKPRRRKSDGKSKGKSVSRKVPAAKRTR